MDTQPLTTPQVLLNPAMMTKFKRVSPLTSLASFPNNIRVYGQNQDEFVLLFIRKDKVVLIFNLFVQFLMFLFPWLLQWMFTYLDTFVNNIFNIAAFFESKYWTVLYLIWFSYILRGAYNIFFKWYYDVNILTTNRFVDLDLINLFKNRLEETSLLKIEDAKDTQSGLVQSIFDMGDLEIFTASGQTVFNLANVPQSNKIRDFIMDVVLEERKKPYAGND